MRGELKGAVVGFLLMLSIVVVYLKMQPQIQMANGFEEEQEPREYVHVAPAPTGRPSQLPRVCLQGDTSDEYYRCRREALLRGCSEICDTSNPGEPSLYFNFVRKHVDCAGVWMNEEIDASLGEGQWPPPDYPPNVFLADYQQQGNVEVVKYRYMQQRYSGGNAAESQWSKEHVEALVAQARAGQLGGSYSVADTNEIRTGLQKMDIRGKRVLVIGSERPWLEACAIEAGAAEVWTLEYGRIVSTHPLIRTMTPPEAREMYLKGQLPLFDAVLTYSSVEHSGLGRYGDALNPWGDKQAIARAWCVTKPGGQMLLGVMECRKNDSIEYNLHRCYHQLSYPHLLANWQQVYRSPNTPDQQTVMVFRREEALPAPRHKQK